MLSVSTQLSPTDNLVSFERMLKSVAFADELVVLNFGRSEPAALALLRKYSARVIDVKEPRVVEGVREQQVQKAKGDWVLIMDFDEVVTPALAKEITSTIRNTTHTAFYLRRRNYSLGAPLQHGGWGDDYVPRLFQRAQFLTWPKEIHSLPTFRGSSAKLKHYLEHHKDESIAYIVGKTNRYTDQESIQFYAAGLPPVTSFTLFRKLKMEMIRRGIFKLGLLDGPIGLIQSIYQGFSVFITWAKLFELQQKKKSA